MKKIKKLLQPKRAKHTAFATAVSLILIVATIFLLKHSQSLAQEIKAINAQKPKNTPQITNTKQSIEKNIQKINRIQNAPADDESFLEFIQEMDFLKREGVLTSFELEDNQTKDQLGNIALKMHLKLTGDQVLVNAALEKIYSQSALLVPESAKLVKESDDQITYTIDALLYVKRNEDNAITQSQNSQQALDTTSIDKAYELLFEKDSPKLDLKH